MKHSERGCNGGHRARKNYSAMWPVGFRSSASSSLFVLLSFRIGARMPRYFMQNPLQFTDSVSSIEPR